MRQKQNEKLKAENFTGPRNDGARNWLSRRSSNACRATAEDAVAASRKFNFSAGPAMLPFDVLEEVQSDLIDYKGSGMSVMEMSHRSKEFIGIADDAEANLRELMGISDNYKVIYFHLSWSQSVLKYL